MSRNNFREMINMENKAMKNIFKVTALACLMAAASNAMAAGPSSTVSIKGTVKPLGCTPTLSNGGVVDYGEIRESALIRNDYNQLPHKELTLQISCGAPTLLSISSQDSRADAKISTGGFVVKDAGQDGYDATEDSILFGLGKTASGKILGSYVVALPITTVSDSKNVDLIVHDQGTSGWTKALDGVQRSDSQRQQSVATTGTLVPVAIKNISFNLMISAALDYASRLNITDATPIDGSSTISLNYL
jgi:type 1 fimbria pilin